MIAIFIGLCSGLLGALCGVGGGIIMVPAFVYALGLGQKTAVATSLAVIIPTAISATLKNGREGLVDWKVFAFTAIGAVISAYVGATYLKQFSDDKLKKGFAIVMILMGLRMLWETSSSNGMKKEETKVEDTKTN